MRLSDNLLKPQPRMENNSYASTAGATAAPSMPSVPLVAETGQPVPDSQLKPVHSNYVPGQVSALNRFNLKITFLCRWRSTLSSWTFPNLATSSWGPAVWSRDTGLASCGKSSLTASIRVIVEPW